MLNTNQNLNIVKKTEINIGKLNVFVTENKSFQVPVPNPFDNYLNPDIKRDAVARSQLR